jgi:hypothetical protein
MGLSRYVGEYKIKAESTNRLTTMSEKAHDLSRPLSSIKAGPEKAVLVPGTNKKS